MKNSSIYRVSSHAKSSGAAVFLVAGFLLSFCAVGQENETSCLGRTVSGVCSIGFPAIWAGSERMEGLTVRITGYVDYIDGDAYLFPSRDLYVYSAGQGGIRINLAPEDEDLLKTIARKNGGPVTFVGIFSNRKRGIASGSVGRLRVGKSMFWPQEMPGEAPQPPPIKD